MNFTSMDYFVALSEERSFTRAAERLSVTQQTLSAHVANVERELGVRLVNRRVPLTLTYAGEVFLGYARRLQSLERSMRQEFFDIAGDQQGLLGVGIASTRGHMLMPEAISSFGATHPGVSVLLHEEENDQLLELLHAGKIDMAVATVDHSRADLVVRPLYREQVVLLASRALIGRTLADDAPAALARLERDGDLAPLADVPLMMLGERDEPGDLARRLLARSGVEPRVAVHSKNSETLIDLAARDVGACFVPFELATDAIARHGEGCLLMAGLGADAYIDIDVAWRASDHVWSVVTDFYDVLVELFAARPHAIADAGVATGADGGKGALA